MLLLGKGIIKGADILSSMLIRLGGLVAMVCGVLYAALGLTVFAHLNSGNKLSASEELAWRLANVSDVVFLVGALVAVAALATLCILHGGGSRLAGTLVSLATFVGLTFLVVFALDDVFRWFGLGYVFMWSGSTLIGGMMMATFGGLMLGAMSMIVEVLPVWGGVALIVGSLSLGPTALIGDLFVPSEYFVFVALAGVAWATIGFAIFRAARRRTDRPSRVR
jgi:hypothetical protein